MELNIPNLMSIWYCDEHLSVDVKHQMKIHLHQIFNYSLTFDSLEDFTRYLETPIVQQIVFIITSAQAKYIQRIAQRRSQCVLVYLFTFANQKSFEFSNPTSTISIIENNFKTILDDLKKNNVLFDRVDGQTLDEETVTEDRSLSFGIFKSIPTENSFTYLNKESLKFLICESLNELLLKIPSDKNTLEHMCGLLRMSYSDKVSQIDEFEANYQPTKAIDYYTRPIFLFRAINRVLRQYDVDHIYKFRCYLADLYKQLDKLGQQQRGNPSQAETKTVFHGKKLSTDILQQLQDNVGHPVSINGLLSTTEYLEVARLFAGIVGAQNDYHSVIFAMSIDNVTHFIRPYARISELSAIKSEHETLFFMGFVWKIVSVEEMTPKRWYVVLEPCQDYDCNLIKHIKNIQDECPLLSIADILQELGDFPTAKQFYQLITKNESFPEETRGRAEYGISMLAAHRGEIEDQREHLEKAEKLIKQTATSESITLNPSPPLFSHDISPSRMRILNNIGDVYQKTGDYITARDYFERALAETGTNIEKASVLNNYGLLEFQQSNYQEAHDYFNQAVQLAADDARVTDFKKNLTLVVNVLERVRL